MCCSFEWNSKGNGCDSTTRRTTGIYAKNGLSFFLAISFPKEVSVFCFPADLFGFYSSTFDLPVGGGFENWGKSAVHPATVFFC